ncbi:REP element-mobilizing transposase RayT [Pseudomonas migulae]|nr:REP element-mobilizing transposase RayT [Pseudomonas migulae]
MPTQPNSHRLRLGRHSETGRAYLITAVIHDRQPVFHDWRLGRLLVAEMRWAHDSGVVVSIAWVVMPDHFHWLMQLRDGDLGNAIGATKARCTRALNKMTPVVVLCGKPAITTGQSVMAKIFVHSLATSLPILCGQDW